MTQDLINAMVAVVTLLLGVTMLAVIFSPKATTVGVIRAGSQGLATDIAAATAPVTGSGIGSLGGIAGGYFPMTGGQGIG